MEQIDIHDAFIVAKDIWPMNKALGCDLHEVFIETNITETMKTNKWWPYL